MGEAISEGYTPLRTPESQEVSIRPHLVTGTHSTSTEKTREIYQKIDRGNLSVHAWDKNVAKELKESNPQPVVISIDGFAAQHPASTTDRDYDAGQKRRLWYLLPGRASEVNARSEYYAVAGDVSDVNNPALRETIIKSAATPQAGKSGETELTKERLDMASVSEATSPDLLMVIPAAATVIAALTAAVNMGDKYYSKSHGEPTDAKTYARRQFLKLGLFTAGAATAMGLMAKFGPKVTVPVTLGDNVVDTVVRIVKHEGIDNRVLDGRTALMMEKGITAAQFLKQPDATVVAGGAHGHNKDALLNDPQARVTAITEYAKLLMQIVETAADKAGLTQENKLVARGALLDNLMYGQILKVMDTGVTQATPGEVEGILDKSIKFQSDFMILSKEVTDSIDTLRGNAPKIYGPFGMNLGK
ncbi:MAG: hypothetical protein ACM3IJ_01765 [Candidatus Levyibacteriota bacterium]